MDGERICPPSERRYSSLCNQGLCGMHAEGNTGYCKRHASMKYARRVKALRLIGIWTVVALIGPPLVVAVAGLLWKLAIWALLA